MYSEKLSPLQIVISYWELSPFQWKAILADLQRQGIKEVVSFLPWKALETDTKHRFQKFLFDCVEASMKVRLVWTPEVGLTYPVGGVPESLFLDKSLYVENLKKNKMFCFVPPKSFPFLDLSNRRFLTEYFQFLNKLSYHLKLFHKECPQLFHFLEGVLTGSYWKYFQDGNFFSNQDHRWSHNIQKNYQIWKRKAVFSPMRSNAFSHLSYLENFLKKQEQSFMEEIHYKLKERLPRCQFHFVELFSPEAYSVCHRGQLDRYVFGDVSSLYQKWVCFLKDISSQDFQVGKKIPFIYVNSLSAFKKFSKSKQHFLLLKALYALGPQKGGIFFDYSIWKSLSKAFQKKLFSFSELFSKEKFQKEIKVFYWKTYPWSAPKSLWKWMKTSFGTQAQISTSFKTVEKPFLFLDLDTIFLEEDREQLFEWISKNHGDLVFPFYLFQEKKIFEELEPLLGKPISILEVCFGIPFKIYKFRKSYWIAYGNAATFSEKVSDDAWKRFFESVYALTGRQPLFQIESEDSQHPLTAFVFKNAEYDSYEIFVFNALGYDQKATFRFYQPQLVLPWKQESTCIENTSQKVLEYVLKIPKEGIVPFRVQTKRIPKEKRNFEMKKGSIYGSLPMGLA